MNAAESNNAIAGENLDAERGAKWSLFPPGFEYRPPIESLCPCGTKHTGHSRTCTTCQREDNQR
jgi:hypothetical protein